MGTEQENIALQGFIDESNESLQGIETAFIELEKDPGNLDIINKIFRPVHSLKGNSGFFALPHINKFAHRLEDLLDFIRKGELIASPEIIDILLNGVDYLQQMLNRVEEGSDVVELSEEEEHFLTEKVEACKPAPVNGSINSVIEFENLLSEAESTGIVLLEQAFLSSVFDHIAKCNKELQGLIANPGSEAQPPFQDKAFSLHGYDKSPIVQAIADSANSLSQRQTINGNQIKALKESLQETTQLLHNEIRAGQLTADLLDMANFLDDDLMVSNQEFIDSVGGQFNNLLSFFDISDLETTAEEAKRLGDILLEKNLIDKDQLSQALDKQEKIGEILVNDGAIDEKDLSKALSSQNKQVLNKHLAQKKKTHEKTKSIRIDQNILDGFAESVGELFINVDAFNFLTKKLESQVDNETMTMMVNNISSLDSMLDTLHNDLMSVRKIPINTLVQRFPRVIRQLSSSLDKDIDFRLVGEDTVIDKDLLEVIENPLVHILRNSVDHGIEAPGLREEKNKTRTGILELTTYVDEFNVYIVIKDDGAGIDPEVIKKVAVKKDYMTTEEVEKLSNKELINLIFKPGFSCAAKVTDVSGRGVGMDAVMAGLDQCNGTINVESEVDIGTTVTLTIPLTRTLVTKDALVVEVSGQLFAIRSEDITTTIYPGDSMVKLLGGDSGISYNDNVLQLINTNNFFFDGPNDLPERHSEQVIVMCERYGVALVVDKMFNHQQIVVKVFKSGYKQFKDIPGVYGYTILGNEDIVLIIDVEKMVDNKKVQTI